MKEQVNKLDQTDLKKFENDPQKILIETLEGSNKKLKEDIAQMTKEMADMREKAASMVP